MKIRFQSYPMVILLLLVVAAILLINRFRPFAYQPQAEDTYAFVINSSPRPTAKCERFETRLLSQGTVYLYLLRDSTRALPSYGDTILAKTRIEWYHTTGRAFAFNYAVRPVKSHQLPLQVQLYNRLQSAGLSGDELATVGALTLGYKEDLDPTLKQHFQAAGAAHVLAVSGLHTGIIYTLLIALFTAFGCFKPLHENPVHRCLISILIIAAMWAYAWLTGLTPSVVRAVVMLSLVEIGRMIYRQSVTVNTIAAAAVLILIVRPTDLWSVSFQLSFAATFAIVLVAKRAESFLHTLEWEYRRFGKPLAWIVGTITISLAAQLGTLPITMYYFGQFSTYFLLTNLIVLPLATLLVPCGLLSIALSSLASLASGSSTLVLGGSTFSLLFPHITHALTFLSHAFTRITYALAWLMNHAVAFLDSLPHSTIPCHIPLWMLLLYYPLLLTLYALIHNFPTSPKQPKRG